MTTSHLKIALFDAVAADLITWTEQRILTIFITHNLPALTYAQLVEYTGYTRRTLTRVMGSLLERGYLARDEGTNWTLDPAAFGVGSEDHMIAGSHDPAITPGSTDHPAPRSEGDRRITPGSQDHGPSQGIPMPQNAPPRVRASSSSDVCVFNPRKKLDNPHDEDVARELVQRLRLSYPQAREAVRANPAGIDIGGWLAWLDQTTAQNPMGVLVRRLQRGEPIPVIYAPRVGTGPSVPAMPSAAELADIRRRRQERQHARRQP